MSKHTPGPWEWDEYGNITADGALIARVDWRDGDRNEPLIAAAPELLKAAEIIEDLGYMDNSADMADLRRAIAKAKGEQECPGPGRCNDPGCPAFYAV